MANLFISYSSKDKKFALRLSEDLKELGHKAWLDEIRINVGNDILSKIQEGLSESDYIIIVLTPDSVSSGWVEKEWQTKYIVEIQEKKIMVLPLLLKDCDIPPLLKTKKYADFRKNYTIGFARLTKAIIPSEFHKGKDIYEPALLVQQKISVLISKIQSKKYPLSQMMAEALPIARERNDKEFVKFCEKELSGWKKEEIDESSEIYKYRYIEVFCSPTAEINPSYVGWSKNSSSMFSFMEKHKDLFFPMKTFMLLPVSRLEESKTNEPRRFFLAWQRPLTDLFPETKEKDGVIYCYARASSLNNLIEAIRAELTKKLLNLLPKVE